MLATLAKRSSLRSLPYDDGGKPPYPQDKVTASLKQYHPACGWLEDSPALTEPAALPQCVVAWPEKCRCEPRPREVPARRASVALPLVAAIRQRASRHLPKLHWPCGCAWALGWRWAPELSLAPVEWSHADRHWRRCPRALPCPGVLRAHRRSRQARWLIVLIRLSAHDSARHVRGD